MIILENKIKMIIKKMCEKFFHTFLSGNTDKLYYGR